MYTNLSVTSNFDSLVLVPGIMQVGGLGERQFTSEIISNVGGGLGNIQSKHHEYPRPQLKCELDHRNNRSIYADALLHSLCKKCRNFETEKCKRVV